jgi:hypothetical protein
MGLADCGTSVQPSPLCRGPLPLRALRWVVTLQIGKLHLELVAHNISFGHDVHAGIHWRSDTDWSMILGEEVALKCLQAQAYGYNEKINMKLRKLDGTVTTISN